MLEVKLLDYNNNERLGNGEGQGLYPYKTFYNFRKYVLEKPTVLRNTIKSGQYYAKIYQNGRYIKTVKHNQMYGSTSHSLENFK